jgi:hypothetical protein
MGLSIVAAKGAGQVSEILNEILLV